MKRQFAKELKALIEAEIQKQNNEKHMAEKATRKARKLEQLEEEKKIIEQAKQTSMNKPLIKQDSVKSLLMSGTQSLTSLYTSNIDISLGN